MKFGQYLKTHAIDEWKRAYIDYRQLKKQIGRAEQELFAIDAGDPDDSSPGLNDDDENADWNLGAHEADRVRANAARAARAAAQGAAAGPGLNEAGLVTGRYRDVERGLDRNGVHRDDIEPGSPRKASRSPGPKPERTLSRESSNAPARALSPALSHSPSRGRSELSPEHDSDTTQGTGQALLRESPSGISGKSDGSQTRTRAFARPSAPTRDFNSPAKRRWRTGFSPDVSLRELQDAMPKQSRRFVAMLDRELERVSSFYADREEEAVKRYEELSAQWRELVSA